MLTKCGIFISHTVEYEECISCFPCGQGDVTQNSCCIFTYYVLLNINVKIHKDIYYPNQNFS